MTSQEAYLSMCEKFTSGNSHPVERSTITLEEWEALKRAHNPGIQTKCDKYYPNDDCPHMKNGFCGVECENTTPVA